MTKIGIRSYFKLRNLEIIEAICELITLLAKC